MIYELFVVGGMIFWGLIAMTLILSYISLENEDGWAIILPLICFLAIFGLSNAEIKTISINYIIAYFAAGAATWFFIFNTKLVKVRRFLKDKGIKSSSELFELTSKSLTYSERDKAKEIYNIYNSEPALDTFFSRILCWPLALLKFILGDFLEAIYESSKKWIINYKNSFLGFNQ